MRTRIPNELAGASLLGVHNWIKSQVALSNPGASPDYKLSDMSGNRLTLSDVTKNPGKEMMIEVETIQGVRSNPAAAITTIPGLEMEYPMVPRSGNDLTEILPDEIDPAMAERVVAEQGLRRGLHTLNRLMIQQHDPRVTTPTSAALLQMGEIIRSNPSDRTPFTQRTPLVYSPERALAQWMAENSGEDIRAESVQAKRYTEVYDTKIASKYGLKTDDIEKFAEDVLVDFLIAASANRALVRLLMSKNLDSLKGDRETVHKLLAMFPQQPEQFYNGTQRVFVAHPAFIYPAYSEAILKDSEIRTIVKFAKNYPSSLGTKDKLPEKIINLVRSPRGFGGSLYDLATGPAALFRSFLAGVGIGTFNRYEKYDAAPKLDRALASEPEIVTVAKRLQKDPRESVMDKRFRPLLYFSDLGGFYPSPPPKWPRQIMYAIMDTFLENLPYYLDVDDPAASNLTPVRMAYLAEATKTLEVKVNNKTKSYSPEAAATLSAEITNHIKSAPSPLTPDYYKNFQDGLNLGDHKKKGNESEIQTHLLNLAKAISNAILAASSLKAERTLTFDPSGPPSILEMAYEVAETAQAKYNYNMRGDDFKFVMAILHYSLEAMKTHTPSKGMGFSSSDFDEAMNRVIGATGRRDLQEMLEKAQNSNLDDNYVTGLVQQAVLADLYAFNQEVTDQLAQPMTTEQREIVLSVLRDEYQEIRKLLPSKKGELGATFEIASQNIFREIRDQLNRGA